MIRLNHTIVWCRRQEHSAQFLADILGLPAPRRFAHFHVVELANDVSLDFASSEAPIRTQHYAFLVADEDFEPILNRVRGRGLEIYADPGRGRAGEVNHRDGGRGFYFEDPDGHVLEILTRPYGSGGPGS